MNPLRILVPMLLASAVVLALGCSSDPSGDCRLDPGACGGDVGSFCSTDADCDHGYCCTDTANCAGGMCSIPCRVDPDCPEFMACQHDSCFFRCARDADCAPGQTCEHGNTICEWP
ncbi:MAG: hypothetical protein OEY14_14600 [Myxococcales bacterium]|nr:hypothetical protein [Myxococcales bacterium]